ncbi:ABC transporter ATP-binding protein [Actinacidiphila glaucinigra]
MSATAHRRFTVGPGSAVASDASGGADELRARGEVDRTSAIVGAASVRASAGIADGAEPEVVGYVWQQTSRNLLPYLTALQNVVLPMRLAGGAKGRRQRATRAAELLELLGIAHCADRRPQQMSGGEQQRTAVAVALANHPALVLADETTGQLDSANAEQVFAAFRTANQELGTTIVIVTHDQAVAQAVDRTVAIRDGRTASEVLRHTTVDDQGNTITHAREYATVDRAGRLQLPGDFATALDIRHRVLLDLEPDHIEVRPDPHDN